MSSFGQKSEFIGENRPKVGGRALSNIVSFGKVKERGRRKEDRRRVMQDAGKFGTGIDTL